MIISKIKGYSEQKSILYNRQSKYQQILVFESAEYGRVLVLDGVIQFTERDEFSFHEMLVHIPLFCHENPEHVLIVGGGDGGVLREVLKHCDDDEGDGSSNDNRRSRKKLVKKVTVCEIDPAVIDVAKTFFARGPMNCKKSFEHPCVNIVHEDGAEFLSSCGEKFDVILIDFAEPFGPAESLFQPSFYDSMKESLNDNGIVSAQGECFWTQLDYITDVIACCTDIFGSVDYCSTMVPTYPTGQMGFLLAGKEPNFNFRKPLRKPSPRFQEQLQWYNTALHSASFSKFFGGEIGSWYNSVFILLMLTLVFLPCSTTAICTKRTIPFDYQYWIRRRWGGK